MQSIGPVPRFGDRRRARIGLLGGSFNPAHEGHLHISLEALKRLRLDEVWWLVSPQNPLKSAAGIGNARIVMSTLPFPSISNCTSGLRP